MADQTPQEYANALTTHMIDIMNANMDHILDVVGQINERLGKIEERLDIQPGYDLPKRAEVAAAEKPVPADARTAKKKAPRKVQGIEQYGIDFD